MMDDLNRIIQQDPSNGIVTIDGKPLAYYGVFLLRDGWTVDEADMSASYQSVPGRYGPIDISTVDGLGSVFVGSSRKVTLNVASAGALDMMAEAQHRLGALAGRRVSVGGLNAAGTWRGRLSVGSWEQTVETGGTPAAISTTLAIDADPLLYGAQRVQALAEGRTVFAVRGNRPAWPVFTLTPKSGARTLAVGDGTHAVTLPDVGSAYSGSVVVDCAAHAVRVNGNLSRITLNSDYFPLLPKLAAITCTNCSGSLSYEPLTLI